MTAYPSILIGMISELLISISRIFVRRNGKRGIVLS